MLLSKAFTKFGKTLVVGNRKRNARKSKLKTYEAAEVLEDRLLLAAVYGDFNGDGAVDQATSDAFATVGGDDKAGTVSVSYGSSAIATQLWSQDSPGIEGGAEKEDLFGSSLAVGDFNNDGYDDLAIGVPWEDLGRFIVAVKAGAVNVIYGSQLGLDASEAQKDQIWHQDSVEVLPGPFNQTVGIKGSAQKSDYFGSTLEVADFNNDGYDDLAIGVTGESKGTLGASWTNYHGGVNIIYGSEGGLTAVGNDYFDQDTSSIAGSAEGGDYFGSWLSHGDFNGDGYDDLVVGVPDERIGYGAFDTAENAGAVNVIYGSSSGLRALGNQIWHKGQTDIPGQAKENDRFGSQTVSGDFNDDGYDDLAISVPGRFTTSILGGGGAEVIVIYGSSDRLQAVNARGAVIETQVWRGKGKLSVDDFNDDGFVDLRIGNSTVHYGSSNGLKAPSIFTAPTDQELAPTSDDPVVQFPNAPRFLSPAPQADGSPTTLADTTPTLNWTRVIGASEYDLVIYDKAGGFEVLYENALKTSSFTTPQLTAGRVYQAFVRAENAAGVFTPYSSAIEFKPLGDSKAPVGEFVANWTAALEATSYDLVAYDTKLGKEVANYKGIAGNSIDLAKSVSGIDEFTVYTRPQLSNGATGNWTKVESFGDIVVDPIDETPVDETPVVPTLLGPVGDSNELTPRITWADNSNASTYELLIYNKDKGQQFLSKTGIEFESFRIQDAMAADTTYQVFVRGSKGSQKSAWSTPIEFKTTATLAAPRIPTFLLHKGIVFNPNIVLSSQPTIGWDSNTPGETYEVWLYNKLKGQLVESARGLTEASFTPTEVLDSSGKYQMFVRAVNANGLASSWSSRLEFSIKTSDRFNLDLAFINPEVFFAV